MIEPVSISVNYQLAQKLLDASVLRQQAIATNIANAETPGFRRVDVAPDFATALRAQFANGAKPSSEDLAAISPHLAEDTDVHSVRPDGNSVELESELLAMNKNHVDYEFLTDVVSGDLKQLKVAITGNVS
jgi:flagellar basal-body rod protein FlgB